MPVKTNVDKASVSTPGVMVEEKQDGLDVFKPAGALAANVPEYLQQYAGDHQGSEQVSQDDMLIPRLAIAQDGMSPQLKKHTEVFIPGLQAGQLFNTVTNEIYGDSVLVVPIMFYKQVIEFKPMNEGGGVVAQWSHKDQVPPEKLAWLNGEKPLATEFKNRLCLLVFPNKKPELISVSFKASGLKAAKKWNSLIATTNLPAFARSYKLVVKTKVDGSKSWYVLDVEPDQFVPQQFFDTAKSTFEGLQEGGFKVDTSGLETDETSDEKTPF